MVLQAGVLRFCGRTVFAPGLWAGVELDEPAGKNNGSIDGILYFRCPPNYGLEILFFMLRIVYFCVRSFTLSVLGSIFYFCF